MTTDDLRALGEFGLIERIIQRLGDAAARDILVPPGDDAAAWRSAGAATLATTDSLIEGVHWRSGLEATMTWADVGWRAIASNVSDIAAMGGTPDHVLVTLTLAPALTLEALDCLIEGMAQACRAVGVRIAGGDLARGTETALSLTVIGHAMARPGTEEVPLLRRDGARVGDMVAVTGWPGASAAGLALIDSGRSAESGAEPLLEAHRRPRARVALGRAALAAGVRCAIDVSDGLLQDCGHLAERSNAGIDIDLDDLPLHPAAVGALGVERARDLALGGGEDYELLFTASADVLQALARALPEGGTVPLTVVGRVAGAHLGEAWALDAAGHRYVPRVAGWDHLRS